jgi:thiol-disulfide isomerase/thioredoxin
MGRSIRLAYQEQKYRACLARELKMLSPGPGTGNLKLLSVVALILGIASTVFVSVLVVQVSHYPRSGGGGTSTVTTVASSISQSIGQPVSSTIMSQLRGVSQGTLASVGKGASEVVSPSATSNSSTLMANGKPEILYIGAEFCPFCATERWPLTVALSEFGTFTGIKYMISSSSVEDPNTSTFTFVNATYSSNYVTFVSVESENRTGGTIQPLSSSQSALINQYDNGANIPFVDFGNKYILIGAQFPPTVLREGDSGTGAPLTWTTIASQLDTPSSNIAQNIDGAANRLISAICVLTGGQPSSVCSQSFAKTLAGVFSPPLLSVPSSSTSLPPYLDVRCSKYNFD